MPDPATTWSFTIDLLADLFGGDCLRDEQTTNACIDAEMVESDL